MILHSRGILGVDRDGGDFYAVELRPGGGGPSLRAADHAALSPEASYADGLRALLAAGGFAVDAAAAAVARGGTVHKWLSLPPLGRADTALAVAAALEDQSPFSPGEACLGWKRQGGRVLAVGTRRTQVEEAAAAIRAAGLRPVRIDLRPLAAAAAFQYFYGREIGGEPAVLVELRREESAVLLVEKGKVLYSRVLPGLGVDPGANLPALATELRATYLLCRQSLGWLGEPGCLWAAGIFGGAPEVRQALAELLGLAADEVRPAAPRGILPSAGDIALGPEYLTAFGLALSALGESAATGLDLLNGLPAACSRSLPAAALPLGLALLLALSGLYLIAAGGGRRADVQAAWLAANEQKIADLRRMEEEAGRLQERLGVLNHFGEGNNVYLEFLLALDQALPAGTRITRLALSGMRVEVLEGTTHSVSALIQRFKSQPLLAGLDLSGPAISEPGGGGIVETFSLTGLLVVPEEVAP